MLSFSICLSSTALLVGTSILVDNNKMINHLLKTDNIRNLTCNLRARLLTINDMKIISELWFEWKWFSIDGERFCRPCSLSHSQWDLNYHNHRVGQGQRIRSNMDSLLLLDLGPLHFALKKWRSGIGFSTSDLEDSPVLYRQQRGKTGTLQFQFASEQQLTIWTSTHKEIIKPVNQLFTWQGSLSWWARVCG